jgi:hypothetical protein
LLFSKREDNGYPLSNKPNKGRNILGMFSHLLRENKFILIAIEYLLFSVTSGYNMIDSILKIDSKWSSHEIILGYYSLNVQGEDLNPNLFP